MASSHDVVSHPFTITLIKIKARQLCRRSDFSRSDYDDLRHDMHVYLLQKSHLFDPARGTIEAFVTNALNTWVAMELRYRRRSKRHGGYRAVSLDDLTVENDGDTTTLGAVLGEADGHRRTQAAPLSTIEQFDLREAIAHAMGKLEPDERVLLIHVVKHGVASAARKRGVSRRQIHNAIARMRGRFEDAGLGRD